VRIRNAGFIAKWLGFVETGSPLGIIANRNLYYDRWHSILPFRQILFV
jgi:hypothetical protein